MSMTQRGGGPYTRSSSHASSTVSGARQSLSIGPVIRTAVAKAKHAILFRSSRRALPKIMTRVIRRLTFALNAASKGAERRLRASVFQRVVRRFLAAFYVLLHGF